MSLYLNLINLNLMFLIIPNLLLLQQVRRWFGEIFTSIFENF